MFINNGRRKAMVTLNTLSKDYPVRLFIKVTVIVLLGALLAGSLLYLTSEYFVGGSYIETLQRLAMARAEIVRKSFIIYVFTGILIIIGLGLVTLFYSHRVAGPLFRLSRESRRIAGGDLTVKVRLRQKDAIHPLAETLNEVVEAYRKRIIDLQGQLEEIKNAASGLEDIPVDARDTEARIDLLKDRIQALQNSLKELKL